ncbi:MAG: hypothetical protein V4700_00410 [Pseudomonadota bacterium]
MKLSDDSLAFYKKELNRTILRICLLPEELIHYFTQSYIPNDKTATAKELAEIIITRKEKLQAAAEKIENFQDYKSSLEAQEDILKFLNELEQFKTMGKSVLLTDIKEKQGFYVKKNILKKIIPDYSLSDASESLTLRRDAFSPCLVGCNSFSDEERRYESSNKELIKKIENKYNFYIYNCIFNYMDKKFKEIEFIAQKNNLEFKDILYLKDIFLKRIDKIDFYEAYFKKEFKREGALNLEINHESFLNYIHAKAIASELSNMDKFAYDRMMSPALRNDYLNKIEDISKLSLAYQGSNKKYIIKGFNADIKLQSAYLKETLKPDMACVQKKLINLLEKLQVAENQYYNTLFFAKNFRKRHSSLQVKINEAKNIVDKFLSKEKEFPKNVKHKI